MFRMDLSGWLERNKTPRSAFARAVGVSPGRITQICEGELPSLELAERIVEEKPEIKVLVMSGFPDTESEAEQKRLPFLRKPFTHAELTEQVRKVLNAPARSQAGQRGR